MNLVNFELQSWLSHIERLHSKQIDMGLARVEKIAKKLNLKQFLCPVIVVGGTNGKGSVVTALENIYAAAGYQTGVYMSPHLLKFNERIRINQLDISDEKLIAAFETIESARENNSLSFFEFTTLSALVLFQQANLDILILEIGLGGRLDAVNIVENDVAIVTSIDFDHMDYLGNTLDEIAYEKASIARKNKWLICGEKNPPKTVFEVVQHKKSRLVLFDKDFDDDIFENKVLNIKSQNAAIAVKAVDCLQNRLPVSDDVIMTAILKTKLPGRFEKMDTPFPMILDVAHNPHASKWLAQQYQKLPVKKSAALVGMLKDKQIPETIEPLLPLIENWYVTKLSAERGSDGTIIAEFLKTRGIKNCYTFGSVEEALNAMHTAHDQNEWDRALIFGSFYTVAETKNWVIKLGENQWKKE